jgi:cysteine desulfuration protein SufE
MSQVWVSAYLQTSGPSGSSELVGFHADCDTPTIKGVLALLVDLMSEKPVADVLDTDLDEIFDRLSLDDHLSPNRHFGIYAIVTLMKEQTEKLTSTETA